MNLKNFIRQIERIAPPELAEEWDRTGLLIEPPTIGELKTILLTVDLTEAVAREAVDARADLILSYHPLFFGGIERLDASNAQARSAMRLIQNNIAVYSPHTALDAAPGGVNDWLAEQLGPSTIRRAESGGARVVELADAIDLSSLAQRLQRELPAPHAAIARAGDAPVRTIALCAGAGASALKELETDCWLTGEMKHHDVLAAGERGISVLLCGHTETERGYLAVLRQRLLDELDQPLEIKLAQTDCAPLAHLQMN